MCAALYPVMYSSLSPQLPWLGVNCHVCLDACSSLLIFKNKIIKKVHHQTSLPPSSDSDAVNQSTEQSITDIKLDSSSSPELGPLIITGQMTDARHQHEWVRLQCESGEERNRQMLPAPQTDEQPGYDATVMW